MASGNGLPCARCLWQATGGLHKDPKLVKAKQLCVWDRAKPCSHCTKRNCIQDCWPIPTELEKIAKTLVALVGVADGEYTSEVRERALAKVLNTGVSFRGPYSSHSSRNKARKLKGSHSDQIKRIDDSGEEETGDSEEDHEKNREDYWETRMEKQQETILSEQRAFFKQANQTFYFFKNAISTLEDRVESLREEFTRDIEAVGKKIDNLEEQRNIRERNLLKIAWDIKELLKKDSNGHGSGSVSRDQEKWPTPLVRTEIRAEKAVGFGAGLSRPRNGGESSRAATISPKKEGKGSGKEGNLSTSDASRMSIEEVERLLNGEPATSTSRKGIGIKRRAVEDESESGVRGRSTKKGKTDGNGIRTATETNLDISNTPRKSNNGVGKLLNRAPPTKGTGIKRSAISDEYSSARTAILTKKGKARLDAFLGPS